MKIFTQLSLILVFITCFCGLQAQERSYLLNDDNKLRVSGFISLDQEFSSFNKEFATSTGGSIGVLFNQKMYAGLFGSGMLSPGLDFDNGEFEEFYPGFGHGGFMLGGIIGTNKLVHLDVNAKFGVGGYKIDQRSYPNDPYYDAVFSLSPTVSAEMNVSKFFKLKAGVGYRYVTGFNNDVLDKNILNSPTGSISLVFGWFGQSQKEKQKVEPINDDQIRL